ncbi:E3 ubiquitin/ISG15 ligase TRIM25-like isoform X2 [Oncorhynchus tshawytscha]|uniref:E3 ubiquitin/ISG15 ligase TRIM25-like n=1 Tax=Oncorhynchus tshawytscha TaxID=74940 RepID=A0A8C8H4W0_ONCTS|nr:E3 ubiquitin/ISG15 ligase TRIM25-like isoform X2 [Oncorhynchus tshawytscha]XP_042185413.1 E3 ubiquitin/ISG15 ligase TRIM25-like isoform X2 [Oncorhynchus tshawytscha]XP_042185414.1 E3 ubiquitin/ISG15 ligase TRIM25-like isoform X2 [Oncorhynchus tshawytscha]
MATSMDQSTLLEDELTCPVCLDLFRDPHLLPCGHNFCLLCVRRLKRQAERGRFRCPECRESHRCSTASQKNFKLANIADDFRYRGRAVSSRQQQPDGSPTTAKTPVSVPCDYCSPVDTSEAGKGEPGAGVVVEVAVKTCLKCEVSMCQEHVKPHLELPAFREHPLTEPLGDLRKRKCPEHDEMYRYYCMDDRVCVCNACTIEGGHAGHTIKTLKNTMKDLKGSLENQLQKVDRKLNKAEKNLQEQKEQERLNKRFLEDSDQGVTALGEVLQVHLEGFLTSLRDCSCSHGVECGPSIQRNIAKAVQDQSRLQDVHSGIQTLAQENDPFRFLEAYKSSSKNFCRQLKKPLFHAECACVDSDGLAESMEAKQEDFLTEVHSHVSHLINELCPVVREEEDSGGEEEDEDDDDSSDGDEQEEAEEEMRSEEEEAVHDQSESADELYSPEEEEEEEEEDEEEEEIHSD